MGEGRRLFGRISVVYWLLTAYMVAALLWWLIELLQLNESLHAFRTGSTASAPNSIAAAEEDRYRNIVQYVGEGSMFLILTLVGASFVHRAARRKIRLDAQQRNFMMAVTHELKTPIAVIRLNLETLQKHSLAEPTRQSLLQDNLREADRLEDLCNKILLSSKYDAGGVSLIRDDIDLSSLLRETLEECSRRHSGRQFTSEIPNGIQVTGDKLLLRLAINNLLENAVRYSPADTEVRLTLTSTSRNARIQVSDQGDGIADADKHMLFQKFLRIGKEDTRRTKGTGLGLYLSNRIAIDHGGFISLENNHPKGSTFILELPKKKA